MVEMVRTSAAFAAQQPLTRWLGHCRTTATTIFNLSAKVYYKKGFGFARSALGRRIMHKPLKQLNITLILPIGVRLDARYGMVDRVDQLA
jgi:hypothetical protein